MIFILECIFFFGKYTFRRIIKESRNNHHLTIVILSISSILNPTKGRILLITDQPTINEATNNVVDGINLDEIKEFAKVFKFRRLSLGLTQTQVGQALSVTEGPAYSQSAICR